MPSQIAVQMLEGIRAQGGFNVPLDDVRKGLEMMSAGVEMPDSVEISESTESGVKFEIFNPLINEEPDKVVIYSHGGGYGIGVYNINRRFAAMMALMLKRRLIMVDYKTAPESPYPEPKNEMVTFYKHMVSQYKPENISMVGDSSGCGLILASLFELRAMSCPMPASIAMMYPMLDMTYSGQSMVTRKDLDPYNLQKEFYIADIYLADHDPSQVDFTPLNGDFSGLPPVLVHGADYDIFLDDATRFHEKAEASGVQSQLKIWDGMWHMFHMHHELVPEGAEALSEIVDFLRTY